MGSAIMTGIVLAPSAKTERFETTGGLRSHFNTSPDEHPCDLYDNRRDLGNQGLPDGETYRGAGSFS